MTVDGFDEDDTAFFEQQAKEAEAAARTIAKQGKALAGKRGAFVAFHGGAVVARGETAASVEKALSQKGLHAEDLYVTYVPAADAVFVY